MHDHIDRLFSTIALIAANVYYVVKTVIAIRQEEDRDRQNRVR